MNEAEKKLQEIRRVLTQRLAIVEIASERPSQDRDYFEGKRDGYAQALSLLSESLESISVEL
jgi:hypothetical protein